MGKRKAIHYDSVTVSPEIREKVRLSFERVFISREEAERIIAAEPRGATVYCGPVGKKRVTPINRSTCLATLISSVTTAPCSPS